MVFLLWPLLRVRKSEATSRKAMNAAIYREQLRELENDRENGTLSPAAFEEAQKELQRRLLAEAADEATPPLGGKSWKTALGLIVALPSAAFALYAWLGNTDALKPELGHRVAAGDMEAKVNALAARLEKNPDDLRGWAMLALSYKTLRRFDDAEKAFAKLGDAINEDASLLASYADLLAVKAKGDLQGKPLALVEKALELEPTHSMALSLAGTAAYDRKDFAGAIRYWERLLKTLPEGADETRAVAEAIERLRQEHGLTKAAPDQTEKPKAVAATGGLRGRVELDKAAAGKVTPNDTVFIFARSASGARMPLAVQRTTVAALPFDFMLDDALSMAGGAKLSEAGSVIVEARVSKSGEAKASSGDWFGRSAPVKPNASKLTIRIDQQLP